MKRAECKNIFLLCQCEPFLFTKKCEQDHIFDLQNFVKNRPLVAGISCPKARKNG